MNDTKNNTLKIEESKPVQQKVDLKKSNPKEYYSQSSIGFKELCRDSEKIRKDIEKISSEMQMYKSKLSTLQNLLNSKKELFALINSAISKRL